MKKILALLAGVLLTIALLGLLACAFAGLLMFAWNVLAVAALSIAVPLTFLTALKGTIIFYGVVVLVNIIRSVVQSYAYKAQTLMTMKLMRQFEDLPKEGQKEDDILRHFNPS